MKLYAVAKTELSDNDWKTQLAKKYKNIPKGAKVKILNRECNNFYGTWVKVEYENNSYYVKEKDLEFTEEEV